MIAIICIELPNVFWRQLQFISLLAINDCHILPKKSLWLMIEFLEICDSAICYDNKHRVKHLFYTILEVSNVFSFYCYTHIKSLDIFSIICDIFCDIIVLSSGLDIWLLLKIPSSKFCLEAVNNRCFRPTRYELQSRDTLYGAMSVIFILEQWTNVRQVKRPI